MKKLFITGVPEHFNYPWIQVIEDQPFLKDGIELVWRNESKGSGAMNKAIRDGETDLAIILTESFIKDKVEGNPGLMIGWYVKSPLIWGIHVSGKSQVETLDEVKHSHFLISRYGSGSHLMAFLLSKRENWNVSQLHFEEIGNLDGAKIVFESGDPKIFLWEKFTTKPLVDNKLFKRIGEIPTPWPCFVIVASSKALSENKSCIKKLRNLVLEKADKLKTNKNAATELSSYYDQKAIDIEEWLKITHWAENNEVSAADHYKVYQNLVGLSIIEQREFIASSFVDEDLVNLK